MDVQLEIMGKLIDSYFALCFSVSGFLDDSYMLTDPLRKN